MARLGDGGWHLVRAPSIPRSDHNLGLVAVFVAITAWGLTSVIIKSIDMNAIAIAFWRFLLYAVMLTVYMTARGGRLTRRLLPATLNVRFIARAAWRSPRLPPG